jgi:hypothetical protein
MPKPAGKDGIAQSDGSLVGRASLLAAPADQSVDAGIADAQPDTNRFPSLFPSRQITLANLAVALISMLVARFTWHWMNVQRGIASAGPIRSVAVLPLKNLSGETAQEYFADGMTDELITELAKISALRVISRTSVMQYRGEKKPVPEIARECAVVSCRPNRFRIALVSRAIRKVSSKPACALNRDLG